MSAKEVITTQLKDVFAAVPCIFEGAIAASW